MTKERWNLIDGISLYEVSTTGKVRNVKTGREIRLSKQPTGNIIVCLSNRGFVKTYSVGRLVLDTFMPVNNSDLLKVEHKDGDKSNNNLDNLYWGKEKGQVANPQMSPEVKELKKVLTKAIDRILAEFNRNYLSVIE